MKDSGQLAGGALAPGMEGPYGDLLVRQAKILRRSGVPLLAISLGNEPGHSALDYPTMTMTDEQMIGMAPAVHERLATKGVGLWALDHNWSDRARADALLAGAPGAFDAVAFHCYAGAPASMGGLAVPVVMTECSGGDWDPSWASTFRWQARNLVVDATANGSTGLLLWNLALDPTRGPHTGGCGNCRGIVTVDPATGDWTPEPEYFLLAHLSRAADPGATRVDLTGRPDVPAVAFANPDGTIGIFGHNNSGQRQVLDVSFAAGHATRVALQPGELFTIRGSPLAG
jgi:glucosylceramidase